MDVNFCLDLNDGVGLGQCEWTFKPISSPIYNNESPIVFRMRRGIKYNITHRLYKENEKSNIWLKSAQFD